MRVAIVGYGAVAAVHVRGLGSAAAAVYGPKIEKARAFADAHGIPLATDSLPRALAGADAAIVCSPTPRHAGHAREVLEAGVHALVELPACESLEEALTLRDTARSRGCVLQCAHTSRYLVPFRRLGEWIGAGELGEIEQIRYRRSIPPRTRSWTDDALLHHTEHPLDLLRYWFGAVQPIACSAHPQPRGAQNAVVLAALENGAPVSISISYTARIPEVCLTVIGRCHTAETDGFSFIRSDRAEWCWQGDGEGSYEQAVAAQDTAFLAACAGEGSGVPWEDTIALTALVERLRQ